MLGFQIRGFGLGEQGHGENPSSTLKISLVTVLISHSRLQNFDTFERLHAVDMCSFEMNIL